jgi:hypothetical protein
MPLRDFRLGRELELAQSALFAPGPEKFADGEEGDSHLMTVGRAFGAWQLPRKSWRKKNGRAR